MGDTADQGDERLLLLGVAKLFLHGQLAADILLNDDVMGDLADLIANRSNTDRGGKAAAILAHDTLTPLPGLTVVQQLFQLPGESGLIFLKQRIVNHQCADIVLAPAGLLDKGAIDVGDMAMMIGNYNRFSGLIDGCRELQFFSFQRPKQFELGVEFAGGLFILGDELMLFRLILNREQCDPELLQPGDGAGMGPVCAISERACDQMMVKL